MQTPLFIRPLTPEERTALEAGLHSSNGFTVRRCHMLLANATGQPTTAIARTLHCRDPTVRNALHDFHTRGLAALQPKSSRPHTTHATFDANGRAQRQALLHQSPRTFGQPTSLWTLALVAEVSSTQGVTRRQVSGETIRATLAQMGGRWKRAKHWLTSPAPADVRNTNRVTA
jgi:Winged helix-turn helix